MCHPSNVFWCCRCLTGQGSLCVQIDRIVDEEPFKVAKELLQRFDPKSPHLEVGQKYLLSLVSQDCVHPPPFLFFFLLKMATTHPV